MQCSSNAGELSPRAASSRGILSLAAALIVAALLPSAAYGQAPAPPSGLAAADRPWDNATRIDLTWSLSADDATLQGYAVRQRGADAAELMLVDIVPPGTSAYTVTNLSPEGSYLFEVSALGADNVESMPAATSVPVTPTMEWFDGTRAWFLVTLVLFCGAVIAFIVLARRGMPLRLREIPGLQAVDDAVGRATEMGRSCLFIPGIGDMNDIQTIAGLTVLARVARTAAEYDATVEVPTSKSLVMTAARETVQTAYLSTGRPEGYNADMVYYVTDEQFGYVAHVQGLMVREKPAACFYMGSLLRRVASARRDRQQHRGHPDRGDGAAGATSVLRGGVRLHAHRRRVLRRLRLPVGRARSTGQPQRTGRRKDSRGDRHRARGDRRNAGGGHRLGRYPLARRVLHVDDALVRGQAA